VNTTEKLGQLRSLMAEHNFAAFIIPIDDQGPMFWFLKHFRRKNRKNMSDFDSKYRTFLTTSLLSSLCYLFGGLCVLLDNPPTINCRQCLQTDFCRSVWSRTPFLVKMMPVALVSHSQRLFSTIQCSTTLCWTTFR
jgi:hypothetical protein